MNLLGISLHSKHQNGRWEVSTFDIPIASSQQSEQHAIEMAKASIEAGGMGSALSRAIGECRVIINHSPENTWIAAMARVKAEILETVLSSYAVEMGFIAGEQLPYQSFDVRFTSNKIRLEASVCARHAEEAVLLAVRQHFGERAKPQYVIAPDVPRGPRMKRSTLFVADGLSLITPPLVVEIIPS